MKRFIHILLALTLAFGLYAQESKDLSILKSIVLPGWGEISKGSNSGYIFLGTEAALWMSFGALRYSYSIQTKDAISYSQLHAGLKNYPDKAEFWTDLGNHISYEHHKASMLESRKPEKIWDIDYNWEWDSRESLLEYDRLHRKKELSYITSNFMFTGMIVNRIASVINVRYLKTKDMKISAVSYPINGGANLQLSLDF
ncbi:MAG: hypothetical protein WCT23_06030 [Candidatus Neomarinimicrobiota bacterium]|jgi:hypothetical protein